MPLNVPNGDTTLFIRRDAFERAGLSRRAIDERLNLTPEEFRMEGSLIAIGPLVGDDGATELIAEFEAAGLTYFDDFFELSGNWPEWLRVLVMGG